MLYIALAMSRTSSSSPLPSPGPEGFTPDFLQYFCRCIPLNKAFHEETKAVVVSMTSMDRTTRELFSAAFQRRLGRPNNALRSPKAFLKEYLFYCKFRKMQDFPYKPSHPLTPAEEARLFFDMGDATFHGLPKDPQGNPVVGWERICKECHYCPTAGSVEVTAVPDEDNDGQVDMDDWFLDDKGRIIKDALEPPLPSLPLPVGDVVLITNAEDYGYETIGKCLVGPGGKTLKGLRIDDVTGAGCVPPWRSSLDPTWVPPFYYALHIEDNHDVPMFGKHAAAAFSQVKALVHRRKPTCVLEFDGRVFGIINSNFYWPDGKFDASYAWLNKNNWAMARLEKLPGNGFYLRRMRLGSTLTDVNAVSAHCLIHEGFFINDETTTANKHIVALRKRGIPFTRILITDYC